MKSINLPPEYLKEKVSLEDVLAENDFAHCADDYREDWERLHAKIQPGDELRRFEPPPGAIRIWGIALVRAGKVIDTLVEEVD